MKTLHAFVAVFCLTAIGSQSLSRADDKAETKEALQALQDFIGEWQANGSPDKPRIDPRDPTWKETLSWAWRFKGDDAWLSLDVKNGKFVKAGRLRYLPGRKVYQLTATDKDDKQLVFQGKVEGEYLSLIHISEPTRPY